MVASAVAFAATTMQSDLRALSPEVAESVLRPWSAPPVWTSSDRLLLGLARDCRRWAPSTRMPRGLRVPQAREPVWTARVRVAWADALDRRGRPGDGAGAEVSAP